MAGQTAGCFSIWQAMARPLMLPVAYIHGVRGWKIWAFCIPESSGTETVLLSFHSYKWNSMRCFELPYNLNSRLLGGIPADVWKAGSPA